MGGVLEMGRGDAMTALTSNRSHLDDALDEATSAQLAEIEHRTGLTIPRLRKYNRVGLAGWIRREVADVLDCGVGELWPGGER